MRPLALPVVTGVAMRSGWVDRDAQATIDHYAAQGVGRDLALRVYTTRLLGRDPTLVLHGGGNTSVKTTLPDLLGEEVAVLCVKGSGAEMAASSRRDFRPCGSSACASCAPHGTDRRGSGARAA